MASGSTCTGPQCPALPQALSPHGGRPGLEVAGSFGAAAHRPGAGAAPPAERAESISPGPALGPALSGSCPAGMRGRDAGPGHPAPPEPRSRPSAPLPLSRLVTSARGQSPSSRPAPPRANWLGRPQLSANPGARCSLRQRQQLWQLRSAPPAPRACSAAAAPWRPASRGTYHLHCAPQHGGYTTKGRREKWRKRGG